MWNHPRQRPAVERDRLWVQAVPRAGALWGNYLTYLKPSIFLTIGIATHMVLMTVLGGGRGQWQVPSSAPSSLSPSTNSW